MSACGVGVAETSRVVDGVREQQGNGGGSVHVEFIAGWDAGMAAPPGYAP